MANLNQDTDILNKLNNYRKRAKSLREQGLNSLKGIIDIETKEKTGLVATTGVFKKNEYREAVVTPQDNRSKDDNLPPKGYGQWIASGNEIETALLVKVQNHRDISDSDEKNNLAEASTELIDKLLKIEIEKLFNVSIDSEKGLDIQQTVPILSAARVLQALTARAENVFSEAAMLCYYRIVRELNFSDGAARAGSGGGKSAFVTSECLRGVRAFEHAISRTIKYLKYTRDLYGKYQDLKRMTNSLGDEDESHPLRKWAESAIERMWLDYYLSTNPRSRQIALFYCDKKGKIATRNKLRLRYFAENIKKSGKGARGNPSETKQSIFKIARERENNLRKEKPPNQLLLSDDAKINLKKVGEYFDTLPNKLKAAFNNAAKETENALGKINIYRENDSPFLNTASAEYPLKPKPKSKYPITDEQQLQEIRQWYQNTHSSFLYAADAIFNTAEALKTASKKFDENNDGELLDLTAVLDELILHIEKYPRRIRRITEPTKSYLIGVIDHETGASQSDFDAGELIFAAAAYGAIIDWQINESLTKAVKKVVDSLPDNGRIITRKPFHATQRGYRMLPIGCEMTRSLAQLLQHTNFDIAPETIGRMLKIFEDNPLDLDESIDKEQFLGWNFDGAPQPEKPCVWVTAISVLALDRIVRMLNARINEIVYQHFEVVRPETQKGKMNLNDLIYSDYGLSQGYFPKRENIYQDQRSTPIYLELMRAHIIRAKLPEKYREKVYSSIFYGPPGTGKTTLMKAMALSAQVPLVMLSPSDLMVQGQQQIEGRARDVFDSLSMLTQTVIILDEFDSVFKSRSPKETNSDSKTAAGDKTEIEKGFEAVVRALNEGNAKDDSSFGFLLAGMLPKLTKLHDNAKNQSLVYCLATNYYNRIGDAAQRKERFDYKIPVYPPCRLSRAGTLLYRLNQVDKNFVLTPGKTKLLIDLVVKTTNENAIELNKNFFKIEKLEISKYLRNILSEGELNLQIDFDKIYGLLELPKKKGLSEREQDELKWLVMYELSQISNNQIQPKAHNSLKEFLTEHLNQNLTEVLAEFDKL